MSMFLFISGIVLVLIGLAWAVISGKNESGGGVALGILAAVVGVAAFIGSFAIVVGAREIGIQTSTGRYRDTLNSGWHWVAPWSSTEEWSTRNQTVRFEGQGKTADRDNFIYEPLLTPRLGNQSDARVEITVTWTVGTDNTAAQEDKIRGLWQQYKTFNDLRQDFITPTVRSAVNTVFDGYNPLAAIVAQAEGKDVEATYVPLGEWTKRVTAQLRPLLEARGVVLVAALVDRVTYDEKTEKKLDEYNSEVANTRIAGQKVETAKKEAEANNARRKDSGTDCASLIRDLAAQDKLKDLPAGWQCPGQTGPAQILPGK